MGGGNQSSQSTSTTTQTLPKWGQGPYMTSSQGWGAAQGALPSISALYNTTPMLNVPNLTPEQLSLISSMQGLPTTNPAYTAAQGYYNALGNESVRNPSWNAAISNYSALPGIATNYYNTAANQAQDLYNQFAPGSTGGMSPAIQAAQNEFQKYQLPVIENTAANMGQANSGALLEGASAGEAQALTPLLQTQAQLQASTGQNLTSTDLARASGITGAYGTAASGLGNLGTTQAANRMAALEGAASGNAQIGGAQYQQQVNSLTQALQAAGMPYEVAAQQAQAYFDQLQQRQQVAQTVQMGPFSQIPAIFGQGYTTSSGTASGGNPLF